MWVKTKETDITKSQVYDPTTVKTHAKTTMEEMMLRADFAKYSTIY